MAIWNTRGLRGGAFEEMIDLTNRLYAQKGLAVIQKVPTPITPIAVDNKARIISEAYFEKKSTVDFIGVAQGIAICFDAKETRQLSLPLRNIHAHQIEFMENFRIQKGISFLLVHFCAKNEIFLLPSEVLAKYKKSAEQGGRKSIPYADFNRKYLVKNESGFPVHYLVAVNECLTHHSE
ncbi:MAG: Holliday junction resolvase RecU [Clostridiales bacterium]|jgi:recombination protein U|nr:Holliday junction resolvase RecU [Clostridiales bacterium]